MTQNEFLEKVVTRAKTLADTPINELRSMYPETFRGPHDAIKSCREAGYSRGHLIEAILVEEFEENSSEHVLMKEE